MSHESPCSVPDWLRFILPIETLEQQKYCDEHDVSYKQGGTHEDRLRTDLKFALGLLAAGMNPSDVDRYFWGVRQYGGFAWNGGDWPGASPLQPPERLETA